MRIVLALLIVGLGIGCGSPGDMRDGYYEGTVSTPDLVNGQPFSCHLSVSFFSTEHGKVAGTFQLCADPADAGWRPMTGDLGGHYHDGLFLDFELPAFSLVVQNARADGCSITGTMSGGQVLKAAAVKLDRKLCRHAKTLDTSRDG